ncbi:MAG: metallohydrolase [Rivularia sp. (in: Bacteria)]|nr:metallohydrolase [Rivularia sp. MS3]
MVATLNFFPVDNGDMTLIELESGKTILIDVNIRGAADDSNDSTPDVARMLRSKLKPDSQGRLYVDVFLLSHPDQDHCRGLEKHFHLGSPDTYRKSEDKIFIREIWSSPMVFRRASRTLTLCEDAKAFNTEARRRVKYFRENYFAGVGDGNSIQIMGEDENGKTDDLGHILVRVGELVTEVNRVADSGMTARLLGPLPKFDNEEQEEALAKNRSSVILRFDLKSGINHAACRFLAAGDAEVAVWERLWIEHYQHPDWLQYDILQTPHHCSWRSLSHDSWSESGRQAKVSEYARQALSQGRYGAVIVASCKPISANDSDPPCIGAKREYEAIAKNVSGSFQCTGEYPTKTSPRIMEFEIGRYGTRLKSLMMGDLSSRSPVIITQQPQSHG